MNRCKYLPCEGAAAAAAADEEEGGEERGGRGGDEDVEPALRPQLRAAPRQAAEEEHVLVPVGARGFVSTKYFRAVTICTAATGQGHLYPVR